jgi:hypothetical protein
LTKKKKDELVEWICQKTRDAKGKKKYIVKEVPITIKEMIDIMEEYIKNNVENQG